MSFFQEISRSTTLEQLDSIAERVTDSTEDASSIRDYIQTKRQNIEKDKTIVEKDKTIVEKDKVIDRCNKNIDRRNLIAALTYGEKLAQWKYIGKAGSSTHMTATSTETRIDLANVTAEMDIVESKNGNDFRSQLRDAQLHFCADSPHQISGFNEADIQGHVHGILQDAVDIVNIMIGLPPESYEGDGKKPRCLYVRREANMWTNRPDHSSVFLDGREKSIVTIEDKPGSGAVDDPRVHGQKFDQFLANVLSTHNGNAVGAMTSLDHTRLAWIGEEADALMRSDKVLSVETLRLCNERLMNRKQTTAGGTPDPKQTQGSPKSGRRSLAISASPSISGRERAAKKRRAAHERKLFVSQVFAPEDIIRAFCSLIIAGILLNDGDATNYTLPLDEMVDIAACVVLTTSTSGAPEIKPLEIKIRGPARKPRAGLMIPNALTSRKYYLVGRMHVGLSYNVFRAVTESGFHCVVKMYIREYDEDSWQEIPSFDADGRRAVSREERVYRELYPELAPFVWTEKLCGRHCLITPFFNEVGNTRRERSAKEAAGLYEERFVNRRYGVRNDRAIWRHVDVFEGKAYLYSLGDVRRLNDEGVIQSKEDFEKALVVDTRTARRV